MTAAAGGFVNSIALSDSKLGMETTALFNFSNRSSLNHLSSCSSLACFPSRSYYAMNALTVKRETRTFSLNPKCEVVDDIGSRTSSVSALELLKTSAAERYTRESSSLLVIGINFRTTPVEIREKLSIPEAQWPQAISELCSLHHIDEAAILSTCNRMEIYVLALSQHRGVKEVTEWMSKKSGVPTSELFQHRFLLYNKDATQHLFEVSSGLDSLVLGEGQILAQVRQVVNSGQGVPGFDRKISGMFKHAITAGKRVRTETSISTGSVSVSSAAVDLAQMKLLQSSYATARVLVIGAGKMGKLVIKHLAAKGCTKMVVINRTEDKVAAIREEFGDVEISYGSLEAMYTCAAEADVVFTCTASDAPLFLKKHVQSLPPVSSDVGGYRLFIDISVPRNVGSCVSDLQTARVYNVDDLEEVVAATKEDRLQKAEEAQSIIWEEVTKFEAWKDSLESVPTIKKLRAYYERIRASELDKCMSKMGDNMSKSQKKAIHDLSTGIVNQLLRGPMDHLRCGGTDNRSLGEILENMHALNRIFGLDTEISVLEEKIRNKLAQGQK